MTCHRMGLLSLREGGRSAILAALMVTSVLSTIGLRVGNANGFLTPTSHTTGETGSPAAISSYQGPRGRVSEFAVFWRPSEVGIWCRRGRMWAPLQGVSVDP